MVSADIPAQFRRLEIPGRATFLEGNGELPKIEVTTDWSTAELYLHGAHVTDFRRKGGHPLLFVSTCSRFKEREPIRGGIPIIFPWFGAREGEPMHGFGRTSNWILTEAHAIPVGGIRLRFALPETAESGVWPNFSANYAVTITDVLELELLVTNTSPDRDFVFENCLHTYLAVGDVNRVSIRGLKDVEYLDKVEQFARKTETSSALKIGGEVDRIYLDTTATVEVEDPSLKRKLRVEKTGSRSTVVWNPWTARSQQIPDLGTDEFKNMICIESGNVADNQIRLAPGQTSVLGVKIIEELLQAHSTPGARD